MAVPVWPGVVLATVLLQIVNCNDHQENAISRLCMDVGPSSPICVGAWRIADGKSSPSELGPSDGIQPVLSSDSSPHQPGFTAAEHQAPSEPVDVGDDAESHVGRRGGSIVTNGAEFMQTAGNRAGNSEDDELDELDKLDSAASFIQQKAVVIGLSKVKLDQISNSEGKKSLAQQASVATAAAKSAAKSAALPSGTAVAKSADANKVKSEAVKVSASMKLLDVHGFEDGSSCSIAEDCISKVCKNEYCGNEGRGSAFAACKQASDCQSQACAEYTKRVGGTAKRCLPKAGLNDGRVCLATNDCTSKLCNGDGAFKYCGNTKKGQAYEPCGTHTDCTSGTCGWTSPAFNNKICVPTLKLPDGSSCGQTEDCASFRKPPSDPDSKPAGCYWRGSSKTSAYCGGVWTWTSNAWRLGGATLGNDLEICQADADCQSGKCVQMGDGKVCRPREEPVGLMSFANGHFALTVDAATKKVSLQKVTSGHHEKRTQYWKSDTGLLIFEKDRSMCLTANSAGDLIVAKTCAPGSKCRATQTWSTVKGELIQVSSGKKLTAEEDASKLKSGEAYTLKLASGSLPARQQGFRLLPKKLGELRYTDGKQGSEGVTEWQKCISECKGTAKYPHGSCKVAGKQPNGHHPWGSCHAADQLPYPNAGKGASCTVWPAITVDMMLLRTECTEVPAVGPGGPHSDLSECKYWKVGGYPSPMCTKCRQDELFVAISAIKKPPSPLLPVGICTQFPKWVDSAKYTESTFAMTIGHSEREAIKKVTLVTMASDETSVAEATRKLPKKKTGSSSPPPPVHQGSKGKLQNTRARRRPRSRPRRRPRGRTRRSSAGSARARTARRLSHSSPKSSLGSSQGRRGCFLSRTGSFTLSGGTSLDTEMDLGLGNSHSETKPAANDVMLQLGDDSQQGCRGSLSSSQPTPPPPTCVISGWSGWGACSKSCGGGTQARVRRQATKQCTAKVYSVSHFTQSQNCNTQACGSVCKTSAWSKYGTCSKSCGGGTRHRTRTITSSAKTGCGDLKQEEKCNDRRCPPPQGPVPKDAASKVSSSSSSTVLSKSITEARQNADGTVTETSVEVVREIAQSSISARPWGLLGQAQRALIAQAIEDGKAKHWAIFTKVVRFSSCIPFGDGESSCAVAKHTHQCLKLDLVEAGVVGKFTDATKIFQDKAMLDKAAKQKGGATCSKLHEALVAAS